MVATAATDQHRAAGVVAGVVVRKMESLEGVAAAFACVAAGVAATETQSVPDTAAPTVTHRSEERRVGKECRSRWSPYH